MPLRNGSRSKALDTCAACGAGHMPAGSTRTAQDTLLLACRPPSADCAFSIKQKRKLCVELLQFVLNCCLGLKVKNEAYSLPHSMEWRAV